MSGENPPENSDKPNLPSCIGEVSLSPFSVEFKPIDDDLDVFLNRIFAQEAKRLGISNERYEYSNINQLYKPEDESLERNYLVFDSGSGYDKLLALSILRGLDNSSKNDGLNQDDEKPESDTEDALKDFFGLTFNPALGNPAHSNLV